MNTKKAHGACAPLGRCLKSTNVSPGCPNDEKKTLNFAQQ